MNVLVFSPHPDDAEVLVGGTIARCTQKGHDVLIVTVTVPNQKEIRVEESERAAAILGARLKVLDLNPYELVFNRRLVEIFDNVLADFQPDVIYTSWIHDSHQDHVTVAQATIAAARKNIRRHFRYYGAKNQKRYGTRISDQEFQSAMDREYNSKSNIYGISDQCKICRSI